MRARPRRRLLRRGPAARLAPGIRREHQGTALGIAGAGNSGTVLAALFAPALAVAFGWQNVRRPRRHSADASRCWSSCSLAKDSPDTRRRPSRSPRISRLLKIGDCLVVHVLLQRHLRRLRRPGVLADHLLQRRSTACAPVHRRLLHRRRACSPARWCARWAARSPTAIGGVRALTMHVCRRRLRVCDRSRIGLPTIWLAHAGVRRRHAGARHGQRRGVPTRARSASRARSA